MKIAIAVCLVVFVVGLARLFTRPKTFAAIKQVASLNSPVAWEHGWKTKRVIAKYWPESAVGYSLEFSFPENRHDSDRSEISETFEDYGCNIYQGGGSPGAPAYVTCEGVKDNSTADVKLKELMPALDTILSRLSSSTGPLEKSAKTKAREAAQPKTHEEWIAVMNTKKRACKGADNSWMGSGSNGYNTYSVRCSHGIEVYIDTTAETQKSQAEEQARKDALVHALRSRPLTDAEMSEVERYGTYLLIYPMQPYYSEEVERRFNDLMLTQYKIREAARAK